MTKLKCHTLQVGDGFLFIYKSTFQVFDIKETRRPHLRTWIRRPHLPAWIPQIGWCRIDIQNQPRMARRHGPESHHRCMRTAGSPENASRPKSAARRGEPLATNAIRRRPATPTPPRQRRASRAPLRTPICDRESPASAWRLRVPTCRPYPHTCHPYLQVCTRWPQMTETPSHLPRTSVRVSDPPGLSLVFFKPTPIHLVVVVRTTWAAPQDLTR